MTPRLAAALLIAAGPAWAQSPAPPPGPTPPPAMSSRPSGAPGVTPTTPAGAPMTLDCVGPFAKSADEAALVARFGRANVTSATLTGAEGSTERGTMVFPKDPKQRIEIFWHDVVRKRRPASIVLRGDSRWIVRTPGAVPHEVGLKAGIGAVEDANEKPFRLNGFFWDMGGYSTGWGGGKLDALAGGCSVSVRFNPDPKARSAALDKVSGEATFSSSDRAILAVKPVVSQISLDWPE